jgi:FkbM family methyltransferase
MIVEAKTKYGNIWVSDNDFIGKCLLSGDYFEEDLLKESIPYIRKGSIVLDIGANVGAFSLPYSNYDCIVYSFEPQNYCVNLLKETFKNIPNVNIFHNAVGNEEKEIEMNPSNPDKEKNIGGLSVGKGGEKVKMIKIDNLKLFNISVIKIDVEGYENKVIEGAKETIINNRPFIIFESHHINPHGIIEFLKGLNYECIEGKYPVLKNYICKPL